MSEVKSAALAVLRTIAQLDEDVLTDLYDLRRDCPAPLDQAVYAFLDALAAERRPMVELRTVDQTRPRRQVDGWWSEPDDDAEPDRSEP